MSNTTIKPLPIDLVSLLTTLAGILTVMYHTAYTIRHTAYARTLYASLLLATNMTILVCLAIQSAAMSFSPWIILPQKTSIFCIASFASLIHILLEITALAPCFRIYLSADKKSPQKTVPSWVISLVIQSVIVAIHIVGAAPIYNRYLHLRGDGEVDLEGMEFASISWPWIITAIGIDFAAMVKITIVICGAIDSLSSASIDSIDASDIPSTDCLLSLKKSVPSQGGSIDSVQPDQLLWGRAINLAKMSREKRAELYTSYLTGLMGSGVVGIVGIMALLTAYAVQDVSAGSDDPESLDYPIDMYSSTLGHIAFVIMCALIAARNTLLTRLQDLLYRVYGDNSIHTDPSDVGFAGGCEMHWP
ncbi:hypothetical protein BASA50_007195 [Batrachochytrium salamandrivorans]|uniref:G-protein coupled receptors family 1 profile domain-containing protein n=1 Tax=Batrachochytrium salamandrivorans TaxID=1357716 RepID=A0ABQ8F7S7_9FUNG|nr:hypothetical protein BASA62_003913 [Batrachochytrium salamandrivorans]KAH6593634.1 hypothetical protein BASA50_007195 [Batrachochytrium salamandrivorans]KAH6597560.1 hypothetical protein BASA61_003129 [Batrachochytrium salamandrivorans]KAJ1328524.1 hypothetical protein BSLG_010256 [Batrachochytrium salamandrivorans]